MQSSEKPSQKQIDFATVIAETVGDDLPNEYTKQAYSEFISEHIDEFYEIRDEARYKSGNVFGLKHSFISDSGYNGDRKLNINPYT
jgi:hypothetical protein